jgi:hypothetical protein
MMRHCLRAMLGAWIAAPLGAQAAGGRAVPEVAALLDSVVAVGRRQDTAAFRRLAAPDFVFVHSTGRVNDLLGFLDFMRQGGPERVVDLRPPQYRDLGDVVVVTTHQATEVPGRGRNAFRAVDVVRRDGGAWRWVLHQSTRLPNVPAFVALPDSALDAYAGRYGPLAVTRDGARLLVTNASSPSARPAAFRPLPLLDAAPRAR